MGLGQPKSKMACGTCKYWTGTRKEEGSYWYTSNNEVGICTNSNSIKCKQYMKNFESCTKWQKT